MLGQRPDEPGEDTAQQPRRSVLAFIAADNAEEDTSEDSEAEEQAEALMGLAQAPEDAVDWDAPLMAGRPPMEQTGPSRQNTPCSLPRGGSSKKMTWVTEHPCARV